MLIMLTATVFWGSFFPGLEGFEEVRDVDADVFRPYAPDVAAFLEAGHKPGETVICTGKIKHVGSTYTKEFKYLASVLGVSLAFLVPQMVPVRSSEGDLEVLDLLRRDNASQILELLGVDEEYFGDIAKAVQAELQELYDVGCRNVQFDDPNLACEFILLVYLSMRITCSNCICRLTALAISPKCSSSELYTSLG
jgi:hypothetical protein